VSKPIISTKTSPAAIFFVRFFFFIFFAAGMGMLYPVTIKPLIRTIQAQAWTETPCTIISGEVITNSDSDGDTYRPSLTYRYTVQGTEYESNNYQPMSPMSSSGYSSKERIVEQYMEAKDTLCYVNLQNPSEAVLKRGIHPVLLFTLFPFPFILVGLFGMSGKLQGNPNRADGTRKKGGTKQGGFYYESADESTVHTGSKELRPQQKRLFSVIGLIIATVFWNGIVLIVSIQIFNEQPIPIFPAIFMIPFILIGLLIFVGLIQAILSLFNPVPILTFESYPITLGKPFTLNWKFEGQSSRIGTMKIVLTATESATYRRGTDTYTDTQLFFYEELISTSARFDIASGSLSFTIPSTMMHTFESSNNNIIWELEVQGDIANWPDISDTFLLLVEPAAVREVINA